MPFCKIENYILVNIASRFSCDLRKESVHALDQGLARKKKNRQETPGRDY